MKFRSTCCVASLSAGPTRFGRWIQPTLHPKAKGFIYLTPGVDWASRKVLAAKIAITRGACHAVEVLPEAFNHHGTPKIVSADQGSQFTAHEFGQAVKDRRCKISMDGGGACWGYNVFIGHLWKSVKYERVYLQGSDSVTETRRSTMHYMDWHNQSRPHSSLGERSPDEAYPVMLPMVELAG